MKLLLVLNWYPPDRRVPARRWGHLISYLQHLGVECTVLSAGSGKPDQVAGFFGERIIRLPISNRDSVGNGTSTQQPLTNKLIPKLFSKIALLFWPPILRDFGVRRWLRQIRLNPQLLAMAHDSDCIISSYGPLGPFFLGWRLSKMTGKPWIADIRDSFESRDGNRNILPISRKASRMLEGALLRKAAARLTVSDTLSKYLGNVYHTDFHSVYNGWVESDIACNHGGPDTSNPYLYYAGSIYTHRLPALGVILRAIAKHPELKVKCRLLKNHTGGKLTELLGTALAQDRFEILPPIDEKIVRMELSQAIAAVVLEDISTGCSVRNGTITGKLCGLLASGVPGIAVSSQCGEIRLLVNKVEGWHGVDTVQDCSAALADLLNKPRRAAVPVPDGLKHFHVSVQAEKLLAITREVRSPQSARRAARRSSQVVSCP